MQLKLSSRRGAVRITVGFNVSGDAVQGWARFEADEAPEAAALTRREQRALLASIRDAGYYGRFETDGALRIGTTQSYQAGYDVAASCVPLLASLSFEALRDVLVEAYTLHHRLAPSGRLFTELTAVYSSADQSVREAIRQSLRGIAK